MTLIPNFLITGILAVVVQCHRIPRRNRPGTITERFPTAAPVTEAFLREAYVDIGLATTHIEHPLRHDSAFGFPLFRCGRSGVAKSGDELWTVRSWWR